MSDKLSLKSTRSTEVFDSIDHYKTVAGNIISHLCGGHSSDSYLYNGIEVEYIDGITDERVVLDYLNSKIVIQAPRGKLSVLERRKRTMYYLTELSKSAEAMRVMGISQIYVALKQEAREKISEKSI